MTVREMHNEIIHLQAGHDSGAKIIHLLQDWQAEQQQGGIDQAVSMVLDLFDESVVETGATYLCDCLVDLKTRILKKFGLNKPEHQANTIRLYSEDRNIQEEITLLELLDRLDAVRKADSRIERPQ